MLERDQSYGPHRKDWDPILFKLHPSTADKKGKHPQVYCMYNGNIVLDGYGHGVRDFGDDLPMCLSSEIEGHDIEVYTRRNAEIKYYDLLGK